MKPLMTSSSTCSMALMPVSAAAEIWRPRTMVEGMTIPSRKCGCWQQMQQPQQQLRRQLPPTLKRVPRTMHQPCSSIDG